MTERLADTELARLRPTDEWLAEMIEAAWSETPPTDPGWYWWRSGTPREIVLVVSGPTDMDDMWVYRLGLSGAAGTVRGMGGEWWSTPVEDPMATVAILTELQSARRRIAGLEEETREKEVHEANGASNFADLLLKPKWKERIEQDGIDCPGLISDALSALEEAPDGD